MKIVLHATNFALLRSWTASLMAALVTGSLLCSGVAAAATTAGTATATGGIMTTSSSAKATAAAANQQQRIQAVITKGDQEISRRLTTLSTLTTKIATATKLSTSDKTTLSTEVTTTASDLTTLKSQLDAETTITGAHTDAQSIYDDYRVYALVAPKVGLVKVADDQQVIQAKLSSLAQKLQTRLTAVQQTGKTVTTLQSQLSDVTTKLTAAEAISSAIESSVISLQPSDYNSNHSVLSGDNSQLKTAHADDQAAINDAKNIITALKSL